MCLKNANVSKSEWQFTLKIAVDLFQKKKRKKRNNKSKIELNAASANIVNEIYHK